MFGYVYNQLYQLINCVTRDLRFVFFQRAEGAISIALKNYLKIFLAEKDKNTIKNERWVQVGMNYCLITILNS